MHIRILTLAVLAVCFLSAAPARELVINNLSGSDYHNDRGLVDAPATFGPYRTIMRALLVAEPGDTIVLTDTGVPYRECISLNGRRHSGTEFFPFRIIGNGAVLDGSTSPRPDGWEIFGDVYQYIPPRPGYALMMLDGRALPRFVAGSGDLSAMPVGHWAHLEGRLFYRPPRGTSPLDQPLEITSQAVGITLYDVEHVIISDLTVRGYRLDGINAHDKANDVQLVGIAARHNGRSGISIGGSSSVTIGATLCELNGVAQLRTEGQSQTYLANVDLAEGVGATIAGEGGKVLRLPRE